MEKIESSKDLKRIVNINSMDDFEQAPSDAFETNVEVVDEENEDALPEDDVDASEVDNALQQIEKSNDASTQYVKKLKKSTKKSISQLADEIVATYLADKSDKNWTNVQEFFWFGLKQFSFKFTQNWDDAYDMTIETFIQAHDNISQYNPEKAKFSTWLWTICRNRCLYFIRQKNKIQTVDNDISDIYDSEMLESAVSQDLSTMEFQVRQNGNVDALSKEDVTIELYNDALVEMDRLGGLGGQIMKMKLIDDMKIKDIADKLNMNESTVKNYLYKSKRNLAKILQVNHKNQYDMYVAVNNNNNMSFYN